MKDAEIEAPRSRYGADLKVSFGVDQSLIGGLIIRVGDQVLDNSLRTRLTANHVSSALSSRKTPVSIHWMMARADVDEG